MGTPIQNTTAILVFANSSIEELKHKTIKNGEGIFDALTAQTLEIATKTKLPYFHFSEKQQVGLTFGERFTNAVQAIFEKGYDQIITIGNDSPQLRASHILEAEQQLHHKKFVLGPSVDGGFYLMGLHKSHFNKSEFLTFSWQTSSLSRQVIAYVSRNSIEINTFKTFFDIDAIKDVKFLASYAFGFSKTLLKLFSILLSTKALQLENRPLFNTIFLSETQFNKGSPILQH